MIKTKQKIQNLLKTNQTTKIDQRMRNMKTQNLGFLTRSACLTSWTWHFLYFLMGAKKRKVLSPSFLIGDGTPSGKLSEMNPSFSEALVALLTLGHTFFHHFFHNVPPLLLAFFLAIGNLVGFSSGFSGTPSYTLCSPSPSPTSFKYSSDILNINASCTQSQIISFVSSIA